MKKIAIIYGTLTGNTEVAANRINNQLIEMADVIDIACATVEELNKYDFLFLRASTYTLGDLQDYWERYLSVLKKADLTGKTIALFGLGDSYGYPDTFVDAMGIIYHSLKNSGCTIVGSCPSNGYSFNDSKALIDGKFVGLPLDYDNQEGLTDSRIAIWLSEIIPYLQ